MTPSRFSTSAIPASKSVAPVIQPSVTFQRINHTSHSLKNLLDHELKLLKDEIQSELQVLEALAHVGATHSPLGGWIMTN